MNGVAALLVLATLGVNHTWRTTPEGRLECVIQVEPALLQSLAEGRALTCDVPANEKQVDQLCLKIAAAKLKQLPAGQDWEDFKPTKVAAAKAAGEPTLSILVQGEDAVTNYDVRYGWDGKAQNGRSRYLVQLDPKLINKLREGDEIYTAIEPDAGQIGSFIISAGRQPLPREKAAGAVDGGTTAPPLVDATAADGPSQYASGPANNLDTPIGAGAATSGAAGNLAGDAANLRAAADEPKQFSPLKPWNKGAAVETDAATPAAANVDQPIAAPPARQGDETQVGSRPPANPVGPTQFGPPQFGPTQFGQPGAGVNHRAATAPPTVNTHVNTHPGAIGHPNNTTSHSRFKSQATPEQPVDQPPPQQQEQYRTPPETEPADRGVSLASHDTGFRRGATPLRNNPSGQNRVSAVEGDAGNIPPTTYIFTFCLLALSIGGNLYLGWTAAEFYTRYRSAMERLRSGGR